MAGSPVRRAKREADAALAKAKEEMERQEAEAIQADPLAALAANDADTFDALKGQALKVAEQIMAIPLGGYTCPHCGEVDETVFNPHAKDFLKLLSYKKEMAAAVLGQAIRVDDSRFRKQQADKYDELLQEVRRIAGD